MPLPSSCTRNCIAARGGVGLKAEHYRTIIDLQPDMGFFEVHAENYMGAGGPPHRYLSAIRDRYSCRSTASVCRSAPTGRSIRIISNASAG